MPKCIKGQVSLVQHPPSQQATLVSSEGRQKRAENFQRTQIWLPGCVMLHAPFWGCMSINSFAHNAHTRGITTGTGFHPGASAPTVPVIPAPASVCWKQSAPVQLLCSAGGGAAGPVLCFHHQITSSLLLSHPHVIAAAGRLARRDELRLELVC